MAQITIGIVTLIWRVVVAAAVIVGRCALDMFLPRGSARRHARASAQFARRRDANTSDVTDRRAR